MLQPMQCYFAHLKKYVKGIFKYVFHINILFNMLYLCIQQNGNKHKLYNADKLVAYMYVSFAVHTNRSDTYSLLHASHYYHPFSHANRWDKLKKVTKAQGTTHSLLCAKIDLDSQISLFKILPVMKDVKAIYIHYNKERNTCVLLIVQCQSLTNMNSVLLLTTWLVDMAVWAQM